MSTPSMNRIVCKMNCIVCKTSLDNMAYPEGNHPIGGVAFRAHGHYGSGAFDPMDGTYLAINICDACLLAAGAEQNVMMGFPQPAPPPGPMMHWPLTPVEDEATGPCRAP